MISWAQELFTSSIRNHTLGSSHYERGISGQSTPFTAISSHSNLSEGGPRRLNDRIIEAMQYEQYLSAYPFGNKDVLLSILQFCDERTLFVLSIVRKFCCFPLLLYARQIKKFELFSQAISASMFKSWNSSAELFRRPIV